MPNNQEPQPQTEYRTIYLDEHGEYCLIPLNRGQVAMIDASDFATVSQWKWHARWNKRMQCFYAGRTINTQDGRNITVLMAREILNAPSGLDVDHRDHRTLNNRRYNLRLATDGQNACNRSLNRNNTSGFKGVSFKRSNNAWQAAIRFQGKTIYLGLYDTPAEAHDAYCAAALRIHGDFACTG